METTNFFESVYSLNINEMIVIRGGNTGPGSSDEKESDEPDLN